MEIVDFENYLIYPDGKVYNQKYKRYLKLSDNGRGYLQVMLCKDGNRKIMNIHRLVAEHYIPNLDNKPCVDHMNRDRKDNRVENLRWATYSENNDNTGLRIDNKLGIKNISYDKLQDRYRYQKTIRQQLHKKVFKTLEDAIAYKEYYEGSLNPS